MTQRIEKSWRDIPEDAVIDFGVGSNWSWGNGGHPLADEEYFVSYIDENMVETRYKLPDFVNKMLIRRYEYGQDDVKAQIKRVLPIRD